MVVVLSIDVGTKNMGLAVVSINNSKADILEVGSHDLRSGKDVITSRVDSVFALLKPRIDFYKVDKIYVEKQTPKNTVAMCIMYIICSFATSQGIPFVAFDPKCKFGVCDHLSLVGEYSKRKKLSVIYAQRIMQYLPSDSIQRIAWEQSNGSKRDDMADALVQALVGESGKQLKAHLALLWQDAHQEL